VKASANGGGEESSPDHVVTSLKRQRKLEIGKFDFIIHCTRTASKSSGQLKSKLWRSTNAGPIAPEVPD